MTVVISGDLGIVVSGNTNTLSGITVGRGAGSVATNTAVGASALAANTTGANNTAVGYQAGYVNTTGEIDAFGYQTLDANTTGQYNAAFGQSALGNNTTGASNTAVGRAALVQNTTGSSNTAMGHLSLFSNTTASNNTAVGYQAGYSITTATANACFGAYSGYSLTTGSSSTGYNTFIGRYAGYNTTSDLNTFVGNAAGFLVTSGTKNTILGGYNGNQGGLDIRTASNYIVLSDGDGNPRIVYGGGNLSFFAISAGAGTNALKYNSSTGFVTYDTSSLRYKDNVRDSVYGLDAVLAMRSTQFEYKDTGRSDVGLIAEELDLIVPELVGKNADNQPDSVSYDRMVSVLVKAVQELNAKVDAQAAEIAALKGQA